MRLYLVRHGEAGPGSPDEARTLTARGRADVERLARDAAEAGIAVDEIRHSGLVRARETAEILAARLHPPAGTNPMSGLRPDDDEEAAAVELSHAPGRILVVTHMPFVAMLAGRLAGGRAGHAGSAFATAELREFEQTPDGWRPVRTLRPS